MLGAMKVRWMAWTALNWKQEAAGEGVELLSVPSSLAVTHPGAGGHVSAG